MGRAPTLWSRACNQSGDGPAHHAEGAWFPTQPAHTEPGECTGCCRCIGDEKCIYCYGIRCKSTSGIETEPPEPEKGRSEECHGNIVRFHAVFTKTCSFTYHEGYGKCSKPGTDMDDGTSGKVKGSIGTGPAPAPCPVGQGIIDERSP